MLMKVKYIISWTISAEFNLIETQCFAVFLLIHELYSNWTPLPFKLQHLALFMCGIEMHSFSTELEQLLMPFMEI